MAAEGAAGKKLFVPPTINGIVKNAAASPENTALVANTNAIDNEVRSFKQT